MTSTKAVFLLLWLSMMILPLIAIPNENGYQGSTKRRIIEAQSIALAMEIQEEALLSYYQSHPTLTGNLTSSLTLPEPWSNVSGMNSVISFVNNAVLAITYYASNRYLARDIVSAIHQDYGLSTTFGLTINQGLLSSNGLVLSLPSSIPAGYAAIVYQVK